MKKIFLLLFSLFTIITFGQSIEEKKSNLLNEFSEKACQCIDSIRTNNLSKEVIASKIHDCIDIEVSGYQLGVKLMENIDVREILTDSITPKEDLNITISLNKESPEYKKYYYEIERYLMANCKAIKQKVAATDLYSEKSLSSNEEALKYYNSGLNELENENYEDAITLFQKSIKIDNQFAFAYDNLGLCYRKINQFDKAIEYYNKSLEIDPTGEFPLQNLGIAYIYIKDYQSAVEAYRRLSKIRPDNPEVFYGLGQIYTYYLPNYELATDFMCQAFNLYTYQNSPYRTDAENMLLQLYEQFKQDNKEDVFLKILEDNNIKIN